MSRDANVILLYGNDEYAIRRRLRELESMFDDASSASMNTARLEARTMSEDDLNNAVNAMPFLARQRLVLLSNPSARYSTPQARKKFCEYLEKVPPTTRLVIREDIDLKWRKLKSDQEKEDDKSWPVKWFQTNGLGLERYAIPTQWEMAGWIVKQAQAQGGQIEPPAAARLAEMVGANPQQAAQELSKLLAFVNWSRSIRLEDVQAVSIVTAEADVFKMVDALAQGNGQVAQRLLHRLLEDEGAFGVWGAVIRQFRFILLAREVIDQGGGIPDVLKALDPRTAPFIAEKAYAQAKRFTLPALERIYHRLLEIDEAAKTGRAPLDVSMEMLVTELAG